MVWSGADLRLREIGIRDGRVAAVLPAASRVPAEDIVDVTGMWLLPGFVDAHFHSRAPGHPEREDFDSGTRAAIAGGVTTVLEMPFAVPSVHSAASFRSRREYASERSLADFALWAAGAIDDTHEFSALAEEGAVGFKIILHPPPPGREDEFEGAIVGTDRELYLALERIASTGRPAAVHCEEGDLIHLLTRRLQERNDFSARAHLRSRPAFIEAVAVAKVLELAHAVGVPVHLPHITAARAIDYIRLAKSREQVVTAETCPHYLLFDDAAYDAVGPYAKVNPPIRESTDRDALRAAVRDGTIDIVGSDHAPYTAEEKERGWRDIFDAPSGCPGIEMLGPSILDMVVRSDLQIARAIQVLSATPATTFGLAPRKGNMDLGADADIVVFDPKGRWKVELENLHTRSRRSARLYEGTELRGRIESVYLRGILAYHGGQAVVAPGTGEFVHPT